MLITATREGGFKPVTVTLVCDTQEEVNTLYIMANYEGDIEKLLEHKGSSVGQVSKYSVSKILNKLYTALTQYKRKE